MKTQLSSILSVAHACQTLGEDRVSRIVFGILQLQHRQQNHAAPASDIQAETQQLVQAMFYSVNESAASSSSGPENNPMSSVPPPIQTAWRKLQSRTLMMDKIGFLKFAVPVSAQPVAGPRGHMGLFDCLVYALQQKPNHQSHYSSNAMSTPVLISIPDLVIFLAICSSYYRLQHASEEDGDVDAIMSFDAQDPAISNMAKWMFLVYDSYQKQGVITQDTLHRFLSDVYGDDSYKTPAMQDLLSKVFRDTPNLTSREFGKAMEETCRMEPYPSHPLLDWMASLAMAICPSERLAESTQVFLQTIERDLRLLPTVCYNIQLHEDRLYEIKRRFHSLVEVSSTVIQGDIMRGEAVADNNSKSIVPKHVISLEAFHKALAVSKELGHGGYLPDSISKRIFEAMASTKADDESSSKASEKRSQPFWDLTHVLSFGGMAVRESEDIFVKFILELFNGGDRVHSVLRREQIGDMLNSLCEHYMFRMHADTPPIELLDEDQENKQVIPDEGMVDVATATMLALTPAVLDESFTSTSSKSSTRQIPLSLLVDTFLEEIHSVDGSCSLQQLLDWQNKPDTELPKAQRRLGPFMMELCLMASVLFGIPPKSAGMELAIIKELLRRHKYRYPQTEANRRGPRGTVWYIIDDMWYRKWSSVVEKVSTESDDCHDLRNKSSTEATPRRLGRISNRGLLRDNGQLSLRSDIKWKQDYDIIPPLAWSALQAWYDGGPPIHRTVVQFISSQSPSSPHARSALRKRTENEIELYPFFLQVFMCDSISRGEARPFQQNVPVSRAAPLRVLLVQLCKELEVDPKYGRLWVQNSDPLAPESDTTDDWLLDLDASIVDQRKGKSSHDFSQASTILLLEVKDEETGLWPRGIDGKKWTFSDQGTSETQELGDGIVGLYNMGNTCYINSPMQCLSHTPIFRDYFNMKYYLNDINTTNPLGHQGRLAQVSAVLINSLWKRFAQQGNQQRKRVAAPGEYFQVNAPSLTPKTFKDCLGKFNDHFQGNEQHDAQEFLAFLLAGLSEDLNRVVDKPYIEAPDSDGRPDRELADIWWNNHLQRELSIIVALFTGQYKSLLTCKSCSYESARFEPFSFLQLPLPEDDTIPVSLIYYPIDGQSEVMRYSVRVYNLGNLKDVLISLSKVLCMDEDTEKNSESSSSISESVSEEEKNALQAKYEKRARNMAVVDVKEGYIQKIAPNTWSLPDLQNKDTGELPLLHVYELAPLLEDDDVDGAKSGFSESDSGAPSSDVNSASEIDRESKEESPNPQGSKTERKYSFLAISQRHSVQFSKDVLHPLTHRVFGTPLLLRVPDLGQLSGRDVYDLVAKHLQNLVPEEARKFLDGENAEVVGSEEVSTAPSKGADFDSLQVRRQNLKKTSTDMEDVAAGAVPRYGFRLRMSSRDGRRCGICPWYEGCIGCLIPDDTKPAVVACGDSLVIDWHFAVDIVTSGFGTRSAQGDQQQGTSNASPFRAKVPITVKSHSSCGFGKKGYKGSITLEDCLDAFAEEEKIPEAYCSNCKDFRVQTKKMSLWRLPPVVVIQLKRFQFTQHMRRKLRDLVVFPVEGLDLSRILAPDDPPKAANAKNQNGSTKKKKKKKEQAKVKTGSPTDAATDDAVKKDSAPKSQKGSTKKKKKDAATDAQVEENQVQDGSDTIDTNTAQSPLKSTDNGRSESLYDLYAVVHHQGALSGGHYVASLKSDVDGQWRLFNDAQIYEIHSRDIVDSSAYILFYIRRDVKNAKLSDFWDAMPRQGEGMSEQDMDKLVQGSVSDRCTIS